MHLFRLRSLSNSARQGKRFFSQQPCSKLFVGGEDAIGTSDLDFTRRCRRSEIPPALNSRVGFDGHDIPTPNGDQNLEGKEMNLRSKKGDIGLSYDTNEVVLKEAFEEHGKVIHVNVVCYRKTAKSKGYGFVKFASEAEATTALQKMDRQLLDGWNLRVSYANED